MSFETKFHTKAHGGKGMKVYTNGVGQMTTVAAMPVYCNKTNFLIKLYHGLTGRFLLLRNFSVAISVSPHVCFILVLILISVFLR